LGNLFQLTRRENLGEPLIKRAVRIYLLFQKRTKHRHPHIVNAVANYLLVARAMKLSDPDIHSLLDKLRQEEGLEAASFEAIWQEVLAFEGPFQVTIKEVIKGGQGETLGLQAGDIYLSYNGQPITSVEHLIRLVGEAKGEVIPLEVLRDGKKLTFTAKLGKLGTAIENRPLPPTTGATSTK
jgi:S1-C subfamily serine protease